MGIKCQTFINSSDLNITGINSDAFVQRRYYTDIQVHNVNVGCCLERFTCSDVQKT